MVVTIGNGSEVSNVGGHAYIVDDEFGTLVKGFEFFDGTGPFDK